MNLGYLKVHLPGHERPYWLVISQVPALRQMWILLTNVPIRNVKQAKGICFNYRRRWGIEQKFRFLRGLCKVFVCLATLALLKQEGLLEGLLELLDSL